jgi:hypothetical protein
MHRSESFISALYKTHCIGKPGTQLTLKFGGIINGIYVW